MKRKNGSVVVDLQGMMTGTKKEQTEGTAPAEQEIDDALMELERALAEMEGEPEQQEEAPADDAPAEDKAQVEPLVEEQAQDATAAEAAQEEQPAEEEATADEAHAAAGEAGATEEQHLETAAVEAEVPAELEKKADAAEPSKPEPVKPTQAPAVIKRKAQINVVAKAPTAPAVQAKKVAVMVKPVAKMPKPTAPAPQATPAQAQAAAAPAPLAAAEPKKDGDTATPAATIQPKPKVAIPKPKPAPSSAAVAPKPAIMAKPKKDKAVGEISEAQKGKRKGEGKTKDKRPKAKSAWQLFQEDHRAQIKLEDPSLGMTDIAKKLGEMWKGLSDEDKKMYEGLAAAEKERVKEAQEAWDLAHPGGAAGEGDEGAEPKHKKQKTEHKPKAKTTKATMPVAPPKTAVALFNAARRPELKSENPDASASDIIEMLKAEWAGMSEEEREPYTRQARAQVRAAVKAKADEILQEEDEEAGEDDMAVAAEGMMDLDGTCDAAGGLAMMGEMGDAGRKKRGGGGCGGGKGKGRGKKGGRGRKKGGRGSSCCGTQEEGEGGPLGAAEEEEDEVDDINEEPEAILCLDYKGKYWVKMKSSTNLYDFKFVDANRLKALRNNPLSDSTADDGFNGYGSRLLELVEEFEAYRREFDSDARACLDSNAGLNFEFMRQGSNTDACAILGAMQDTNGPLSRKPDRKMSCVKGQEDIFIRVPAMMLSFVVQRMVVVWRNRALRAEEQLSALNQSCDVQA